MNSWQTIKRILGNDGGKVAVMENDEVKYIVLTLKEYERLSESSQRPKFQQEESSQVDQTHSENPGAIRIEDLPM